MTTHRNFTQPQGKKGVDLVIDLEDRYHLKLRGNSPCKVAFWTAEVLSFVEELPEKEPRFLFFFPQTLSSPQLGSPSSSSSWASRELVTTAGGNTRSGCHLRPASSDMTPRAQSNSWQIGQVSGCRWRLNSGDDGGWAFKVGRQRAVLYGRDWGPLFMACGLER